MSDLQQRKRGRPPSVDPQWLREFGAVWPDIHTKRGLQNKHLAFDALRALELLPDQGQPPGWLVDWESANRGKQGAIKWCVLEQFGRMLRADVGEHNVRRWADQLEQHRPTAKEAAARLREMRLEILSR